MVAQLGHITTPAVEQITFLVEVQMNHVSEKFSEAESIIIVDAQRADKHVKVDVLHTRNIGKWRSIAYRRRQ